MRYTAFTAHVQPQKGFLSSQLLSQERKQRQTIQNQPISCGFLQRLTACEDARTVYVPDMKSFEKYLAGEKLLEEKTFSTDGLDSLVNNCSVKYDGR